jgi:hypothetical protein
VLCGQDSDREFQPLEIINLDSNIAFTFAALNPSSTLLAIADQNNDILLLERNYHSDYTADDDEEDHMKHKDPRQKQHQQQQHQQQHNHHPPHGNAHNHKNNNGLQWQVYKEIRMPERFRHLV